MNTNLNSPDQQATAATPSAYAAINSNGVTHAPAAVTAPAASAPGTPRDHVVSTRHVGDFGGTVVGYTATCGTLVLHEEHDKDGVHEGAKPRATVFHVAYVKDDVVDRTARPVAFCFNGGPGSSSVWLHMGVFGPQRVALDDNGLALSPAGSLVPNAYSLLDVADLVFIDPVGTGYSRMVGGEKTAEFHDIGRDVDAVAEFIRLWCARHGRWSSPKFLAGESYGTTRACALARQLHEQHGMAMDGLILISCALEFGVFTDAPHALNDLPYPLFLPGFAATAWYHHKLPADLQARPLREVLDEVEQFAATEYTLALFQGRALPGAQRQQIAAKLARYSGLSERFVAQCNLRVRDERFFKELLRDEALVVGRLDSRLTGRDRDAAGETAEDDPSYANLAGPYAAGINHHLRITLKYETDTAYRVIAPLYKDWSWGEFKNRYVSLTDTLRKLVSDNRHLRVYVASGYYDLATPHATTDYALRHLALDDAAYARIKVRYFEAGHMMYIHRPSLEMLAADLRAFVRQ